MNGKILRAGFVAALLTFTVAIIPPRIAIADVNDFTVTKFNADYYLTNADPQGEMRVVEKINVDFTDQNHGILRALPETYHNYPLKLHIDKVSSDSGAPAKYTTYESNGNKVLKIGDPNSTVTGTQEYTITYTLQNAITFYNDHDEIYWNVNGIQWNQPFTVIHATLHLPAGLKLSQQMPQCFTGGYGSSSHRCDISVQPNEIRTNANDLIAGQNLTFVTGFQKGFFHSMTWRDYALDYLAQALEFLVPFLLLAGGGFYWWLKRGRDAKGRGVIVPEYEAPDNLSPLEVGAVVDFAVDNRDLTATIIDLAIRGYLKIVESNSKKLLVVKNKKYLLELVHKDWAGLNEWEKMLMDGLFGDSDIGDQIDVAALKTKLNTQAKAIKNSVENSLTYRGYFRSNPVKYTYLSLGGAIVVIVLLVQFSSVLSHWFSAGAAAGAVIFAIFYHLMAARTAKGVDAKEHILGLKMYLEVAEKDRIAKLQSPDAPYAEKSSEPKHTVDLFEKLLPYAIVLKVEDKWAGKFKDIYKSPPDWYAGNYAVFNAGYLVGSLGGGFQSSVNSSFASPQSSGSSGFGGGFSGGGGGGGGGGGW